MDTKKNTERPPAPPQNAGLVLEGGGLQGLFTAGVLDFFMEQGLSFAYAVGCSAGACNLLGYLSGQAGHIRDCMMQKDAENSYCGFNQLVRGQKLLDLDRVFYEYPRRQHPFDFAAFFRSPTDWEVAVTNCGDGRAEYLTESRSPRRLGTLGKASSSMPLFTRMTRLDGGLYLDGGIADPIPIRRAVERGAGKNIVILTRQAGRLPSLTTYQRALYELAYHKYPELLAALKTRGERYQEQLRFAEREEAEGRAFLLRPTLPEVRRLETNYAVLMDWYRHGYDTAQGCWERLRRFLGLV